MPQYDFRCDACQLRFSVNTRSYAEYDAAALICPECESAELSRLITDVAVRKPRRDYRKMSSGEMLSVLESGDQQQVNRMFKQVGGDGAASAAPARKSRDAAQGSQSSTGSD